MTTERGGNKRDWLRGSDGALSVEMHTKQLAIRPVGSLVLRDVVTT